ncbi:MAG: cell division protein SepF [Propionibacteriaceae bacterium]|jgi:cell division inhibitor SepF|nr:cell division protein SepF [Propionibacteriaceae bacterium]
MASRLKRVAEWAGIVQPSRYEDDDFGPEPAAETASEPAEVTAPVAPAPTAAAAPARQANVTPIDQHRSRRAASAAREVGINEIAHIRPRRYGSDATRIAESYREGIPVILNLSDLDDAEAFRVVDFASGLKLALEGHFEKITARVFLLTPPSIKVSDRDKERIVGGLAAQA